MSFETLRNDFAAAFIEGKTRAIEKHLIGAVEQIEGRSPTNDEIATHGKRQIWPDGREQWSWKGKPILEISANQTRFEDGKFIFEFKSIWKDETR